MEAGRTMNAGPARFEAAPGSRTSAREQPPEASTTRGRQGKREPLVDLNFKVPRESDGGSAISRPTRTSGTWNC